MVSRPRAPGPAWLWAALAGRLVLGGVWLVAGALKLPDPAAGVRAVRAYQLLPEAAVPAVGYGLPVVEVLLGLLLILGVTVRACAVGSALLLLAFMGGIGAAWARGLQIDCGCFGGGGRVADGGTRYVQELLRDSGLLAVSALLAARPRSRLSLSGAVLGPSPAAAPTPVERPRSVPS